MSTLLRELRFAGRSLRRSPGLSIVVILLLGFGIGASTALFSLLYTVLLRPIPGIEHPGQLVRIRRTLNGDVQSNQSYPDYLDYRDRAATLRGLVAERNITVRLAGPPAQLLPSAIVTGNYFEVLGVKAALGRLLGPDDDRKPGEHPVIVLSHAFWREQFGGDSHVLGRTLTLNGYPFIIVGVASSDFEGVQFGETPALWMPMMMVRHAMTRQPDYHWLTERRAGWLTFYGRIQPDLAPQAAQAELDTIARRLENAYPDSNRGRGVRLSLNAAMAPEQRASMRNLFGLLLAAVCLLLLIACGNVANLLLARAVARSREVAIRLALGAGLWTLLRTLLAESLLLAFGGAVLGLLLAPWMLPLMRSAWSLDALDRAGTSVLDPRVLAFAGAVALLTAVLFGLAPAWGATRTDAATALRAGSSQGGRRHGTLRRVWVVAQVALSVALVAGGSLVLQSLRRILAIDPGYEPQSVLVATMDISLVGYTSKRGTEFFRTLLDRVSAIPGVRSATLAKSSPAVDWSDRTIVFRGGEAPAQSSRYAQSPGALLLDRNIVAPGYFATLRIPLSAGRDFTRADDTRSRPVAIVSQALATRLWPGQNPIGRQIVAPIDGQPPPAPIEVIGVAADSRYRSVLDAPPLLLYSPEFQVYDSIARLMVAVNGDPRQFSATLRRAIQDANPDLPVGQITTLDRQIARSLWRQRAAASLLGFFGVMAILLACAGIHGMLANSVAQRTREIGVRIALGAENRHVVRQVAGEAVALTLTGIAIGLPVALWAKPILGAFLYGAAKIEPAVFGGVPLLFVAVALIASLIPARRAMNIDPAVALRQD